MKFIIIAILSFFIISCNYTNYSNESLQKKVKKKNTNIAKDSIASYIDNQLKGNYTPYSYSELRTNKPNSFYDLDTLYKERTLLVHNQNTPNYDSLLTAINKRIALKKQEINKAKLYHTYEISHIYTLKDSLKNIRLYENKFIFYPNFTLKNVTTLFTTTLTPEEHSLFAYFSLQKPLYESGNPTIDLEVNNDLYERFNYALANETERKEKLFHTILSCVKYIKQYNDFNTEKMAQELVDVWLLNHNLTETEFKPKFESLTEVKNENEIEGYTMLVKNKKENKVKELTFYFDLNLVILETKIH